MTGDAAGPERRPDRPPSVTFKPSAITGSTGGNNG